MNKPKVGIYSGSFDPVHAGHLAFALQAAKAAKLEMVYFLPERQPRRKVGTEHFGHRTAMITRAIRPHAKLGLLELPDVYFDIARTLPKLRQEFAGHQLVFLMGSDVALHLHEWPDIKRLVKSSELIVGLRGGQTEKTVNDSLAGLPLRVPITFVKTPRAAVASSAIRQALRQRQPAPGLLPSVHRYAVAEWLYASVSNE